MTHYALYLSQTQFFISLAFMLLFMALELGLSWVLFYFRLRTFGKAHNAWMGAYRFWVRIFALAFIVSFAAAMPVLIQFGSLWPGLMEVMGEVAGPLLAAAMLSLFIFKSCFLGLMLFGQRRLSSFMHTVVVLMVALGVSLTVLCLVTLLAWMHVPTGVELLDGRYLLLDWHEVLGNPALPWYAGLFFTSSFTVVAGFLVGVVTIQTFRRPVTESERLALKTGCVVAVLALCAQLALVLNSPYFPVGIPQPSQLLEQKTVPTNQQAIEFVEDDLDALTEAGDLPAEPLSLDEALDEAVPVLIVATWSYRFAMVCGALLLALCVWSLFRLARFGFDPHSLSHRTRQALALAPGAAWVLLLSGSAFVLLGTTPYVIGDQILFAEVMGKHGVWALSVGALLLSAVYVLCFYGFYRMVRHVVRFGVVPVARHRGRA